MPLNAPFGVPSMNRGLYSSIIQNEEYRNSQKEWIVELQRYHMYWYDLVVNPFEVADYFDTRKLIVEYLKTVKRNVEETLEKRFIYFICSRTKVRFNTRKPPTYNPFSKKVTIHLLVGKNEKKKSVKCKFYDKNISGFFNPKIDLTDKYITLTESNGDVTTGSIHDFLSGSDINLDICSNIEYVGYTENPHTRPTNGAHAGLSEALYKVSNENCDTLIYFNIFKVTTRTINDNSMLKFILPNAMTNEIGAEVEGKIIEKCFILYFDSENQTKNKEKERCELTNNLRKMVAENNIKSVHINYELEDPHDYGLFSSSTISPNYSHSFTVKLVDDSLEVKKGSELFEVEYD